ncbi:MAG: amidohydrolase [Myxococcota bacterium]|nr:amidohydrolase [Myxococcota bacterium]
MILLLLSCTPDKDAKTADFLLYNGSFRISAEQVVDQIAIKDQRVVAIGEEASLWESTSQEDVNGAVILPGFHDSHTHLLAGSFVMERLLLVGISNMSTIQNRLRDYAEENPQEPWIIGFGWIYAQMDNPNGLILDSIVNDRPVALFDSSGHTLMVNSKTLELAGIDANTPDPVGGSIERDPETGAPNGVLKEKAIELISPIMLSAYDDDDFEESLSKYLEDFQEAGLSSISEILAVPGISLARPQIFAKLAAENRLPIRVHYYMPAFSRADLDEIQNISEQYDSDMLRFAGIKLWIDGSTSSGESWSLEPSEQDPDHYGSHYWEEDELYSFIEAAEEHEFGLKLHVNGDAAVQTVLNALENYNGILKQTYLLEHAVLLDPLDYARAHDLGVCISVQPGIATLGPYSGQADVWGEEKMEHAWNFAALEEAEITISLSTDWPVWPTTDIMVNAWSASVGLGDKSLTPRATLEAYTKNANSCMGLQEGCLDVGCTADLTFLEEDPYNTPSTEWSNIDIQEVRSAIQFANAP